MWAWLAKQPYVKACHRDLRSPGIDEKIMVCAEQHYQRSVDTRHGYSTALSNFLHLRLQLPSWKERAKINVYLVYTNVNIWAFQER